MSDFLLLSDADVELLNRQSGVSLTREAWTRRITMTPSYATLVRSFFDWHVSELAAIAFADDRLPAGIDAPDAPFPPAPDRRPPLEAQARLRSAGFLLETIRPIREDGEAREARIRLLAEPLPTAQHPRRVREARRLPCGPMVPPPRSDGSGRRADAAQLPPSRVARICGRARHAREASPLAHVRLRDRHGHDQLNARFRPGRHPELRRPRSLFRRRLSHPNTFPAFRRAEQAPRFALRAIMSRTRNAA